MLIVTMLAACDNIDWGGADVQLVSAPPTPREARGAETAAEAGPELPSGPVVFHVRTAQGTPQLTPVAELRGDSLRRLRRPAGVSPQAYEARFRNAVMERGSEFVLFRRGARVGTFEARGPGPATGCGVPTVTGAVNTVAAASDAEEFIAFRRGLAPDPSTDAQAPAVTGRIQTYASLIAERLILQQGLRRPPSWPDAQRNLQAVDLGMGETDDPQMAATYLLGGDLEVGPADPRGYAVFYVAAYDARRGYVPFFTDIRNYAATGRKAAPRLVDHLSWGNDGVQRLLLEIAGEEQGWYGVAGPVESGDWEMLWEPGPC